MIDGVTRDADEMKALAFPAYGRGVVQQSVRGRCAFAGRDATVQLGGVSVSPGDVVMADDTASWSYRRLRPQSPELREDLLPVAR